MLTKRTRKYAACFVLGVITTLVIQASSLVVIACFADRVAIQLPNSSSDPNNGTVNSIKPNASEVDRHRLVVIEDGHDPVGQSAVRDTPEAIIFPPIQSLSPPEPTWDENLSPADLKMLKDEWERFWQHDKPSKMTPFKTHGGTI